MRGRLLNRFIVKNGIDFDCWLPVFKPDRQCQNANSEIQGTDEHYRRVMNAKAVYRPEKTV